MTPKLTKQLECGVDCILCKGCKTAHMGMEGDLNAEILFVGEAPGVDEDDEGRPFIGDAGILLREAIYNTHIENYAITNAVKCRPPKNRTPTTKEIKTCRPFLEEEITNMPNLKLIVLLGNVPLHAVTGIKSGIVKYSGKTMEIDGRLVLPILHPAYILRHQDEQGTFFEHMARIPNALTGNLTDPSDLGEYTVIRDIDTWTNILANIINTKEFAFDVETTGLSPFQYDSQVKCIGFSWAHKKAAVLPTDYGEFNPWKEDEWNGILDDLRIIFEAPDIKKIAQNAKFDILWVRHILGIQTIGLYWDTKIAQFLLNENESNGLKDLAWKYTKCGGYETQLKDKVDKVEGDELYEYNAVDSDITYRIYKAQYQKLAADQQLYALFSGVLLPVSIVLSEMEERGILIDQDLVQEAIDKIDGTDETIGILEELEEEIRSYPSVRQYETDNDIEFNPNSHVQLREVLFKYESLPILKRTPTSREPSTDLDVLDKLKDKSPLCELLIKYSQWQTMRSKTLKEFTEAVADDGRIHTTYWLTETATGRTSSRKPNLQNLPKGKKDLIKIRNAVIADPEHFLVEFDFNQIELRLAAEIAEDEILKEALKGDVHRKTTAGILGILEDQVTDDQRRIIGKTVNFGTIYGQTKWGLMKKINCTEEEADEYLAKFFETYPKLAEYMENTKNLILTQGWVRSPLGRYRRLPVWKYTDPNSETVQAMIREAINAPIQSLASDFLLVSLIGIKEFLEKFKLRSKLLLEIHDSVILSVHQTEIWIVPIIIKIMTSYFQKFLKVSIPILVDAKYGTSLGNMEEWK